MSTHISHFFVTDSFSENLKFTNLYVSPSFALSTKKYKMSHCVFTHLLWWFCTVNLPKLELHFPKFPSCMTPSQGGVTRKICTRFRRQKRGEHPEGCCKAPGAVAIYSCGQQSACSWGLQPLLLDLLLQSLQVLPAYLFSLVQLFVTPWTIAR